jgi:hypothetical protein
MSQGLEWQSECRISRADGVFLVGDFSGRRDALKIKFPHYSYHKNSGKVYSKRRTPFLRDFANIMGLDVYL